jgi:drug/metabolite transporter (DMT)-like permease
MTPRFKVSTVSASRNRNLTRGYVVALFSAAVLSTTAIFIRYLTQTYQVPALVLAFWRDVFAAGALLPVLAFWRPLLLRIRRNDLYYLMGYGFLLALFNALWTLSVSLNGASISTVLVYSSTGFTVVLGWWLLKEHLGWAKITAVFITLGGCVLVSGALNQATWNLNLAGIVTGILSGLGYAVYTLMGRSAWRRGLNPWTTLFYIFTFAAGFLLIFNFMPKGLLPGSASSPGDLFWLKSVWSGWLVLFLLAAGPTVGGYGLYMASLTRLPSGVANLVVTSEPVFTALTAYAILGEHLNGIQIGGSLMILTGVVLLRLWEGRFSNRILPVSQ